MKDIAGKNKNMERLKGRVTVQAASLEPRLND